MKRKHQAPERCTTNRIYEESIDAFLISHARTQHRRMIVFITMGTYCHNCGLEATRYIEWVEKNNKTIHHDLICEGFDGKIYLLTVDHIIPVSKGGTHEMSNKQPLCARCNERKADKVDVAA